MKTMQTVLDKDLYDTIELVSVIFGGLSRGLLYEEDNSPCCMIGAAHFAGAFASHIPIEMAYMNNDVFDEGVCVGLNWAAFDKAHAALTFYTTTRIPWQCIAKEANIVRGS